MPQMENSFKCGTIMRCTVLILYEMHIYSTCRALEYLTARKPVVYIYIYIYDPKMAASRSRALRLTNDSEQKAQRKSTQKLGRKAVQKNGEKTVDGIEERVEGRVDERIEVRISERTKG